MTPSCAASKHTAGISPSCPAKYVPAAALAAVAALHLAIRLHALSSESVIYDEYITLGFAGAPTLTDCIREQRAWDWHMVPLYHILQYFWVHLISPNPTGVRLLSVLFSFPCVFLVYGIGRRLFDRRIGLVAALLWALSPFEAFHARGIRCYALLGLLGLLSVYTFVGAVRQGGWRWWLANAIANILLMWTHLFGALMLAPEGLILLFFHFRPIRRWFCWGLFHAAMIVPLALWVLSISGGAGAPKTEPPTGAQFEDYLFCRDTLHLGWVESVLPADADFDALPRFLRTMLSCRDVWQGWMQTAFIVSLTLMAIWSILYALKRRLETTQPSRNAFDWFDCCRPGRVPGLLAHVRGQNFNQEARYHTRPTQAPKNPLESCVFLLLWFFLSPLVLFFLARIFELGIFHERYTIHCLGALYIAVGAAAFGFPLRPLRLLALLLFAVVFGYQIIIAANLPVRQGYIPAIDRIRAGMHPGDTVVAEGWMMPRILPLNLRPGDPEIHPVEHLDEMIQYTDDAIQACHGFWAFLTSVPDYPWQERNVAGIAEQYQRYLKARGLTYTRHLFLGMQNIYLYHIPENVPQPRLGSATSIAGLEAAFDATPDNVLIARQLVHALEAARRTTDIPKVFEEAIAAAPNDITLRMDYAHSLEKAGDNEAALAQYRAAKPIAFDTAMWELGSALERMGRLDDAIQEFRNAVQEKPDSRWQRLNLGAALLKAHRTQEAETAYKDAIAAFPADAELRVQYGHTLEALDRLDDAIAQFRDAIHIEPTGPRQYARLGKALAKQGHYDDAIANLQNALRLAPNDKFFTLDLLEILIKANRTEEARTLATQCQERGIEVPQYLLPK